MGNAEQLVNNVYFKLTAIMDIKCSLCREMASVRDDGYSNQPDRVIPPCIDIWNITKHLKIQKQRKP